MIKLKICNPIVSRNILSHHFFMLPKNPSIWLLWIPTFLTKYTEFFAVKWVWPTKLLYCKKYDRMYVKPNLIKYIYLKTIKCFSNANVKNLKHNFFLKKHQCRQQPHGIRTIMSAKYSWLWLAVYRNKLQSICHKAH